MVSSLMLAVTSPAAHGSGWFLAGFVLLVFGFLAIDLGVFHRHAHEVRFREALAWTAVWVSMAALFAVFVWFAYENHWLGIGLGVRQLDGTVRDVGGGEAATLFVTGYIVEESLSVDNVFVIAMVFSYIGVPARLQHRVLFWGILGALLMRGAMIGIGAALIASFTWVVYVFAGILILSAVKMAVIPGTHVDLEHHPLIRLVRRVMPIAPTYDGQRFFTTWQGRRAATPLLLALVMVEFADIVFAVDSIPAIFAITADPFLVFTSNVFAILGLRSLYFCVASAVTRFRFLKPALVLVLAFVGTKMLLVHTSWRIPTTASLCVVLAILATGVVLSFAFPGAPGAERALPGPEGILDPRPKLDRRGDPRGGA